MEAAPDSTHAYLLLVSNSPSPYRILRSLYLVMCATMPGLADLEALIDKNVSFQPDLNLICLINISLARWGPRAIAGAQGWLLGVLRAASSVRSLSHHREGQLPLNGEAKGGQVPGTQWQTLRHTNGFPVFARNPFRILFNR